jgi:drug/metabolite transporter (DMT)-like permease
MLLPSMAAASASILFGAALVATRFVVHDIDPLLLSFIRYAVASLCLAPAVLVLVKERPSGRDLMLSVGLGILCFGLMPWFATAGIQHIPAARAALWFATIPFLTFLMAAALRHESVTGVKLAGLTLASVGVVLALGPAPVVSGDPGRAWLGDLLTFAAAVCGALYTVLSRPVLRRVPATLVTCVAMLSGTMFLGILSWTTGVLAVPVLSAYEWLVVIGFLGIIGGALAFFLWTWAVRQSTPTRTAVFLTLNPMAATLLGAVLLGEAITVPFLIGLALVLAGIIVANLQWRGGLSGLGRTEAAVRGR